MKTVVLAGGRGTRLAPYTSILPKPLMPVGEQSILEVVVGQLEEAGIVDIHFCVGYLAHLVEAVFESRENGHVNITYVREQEALGTAAPLRLVEGLDSTFMVMNGDVLTTLDYRDLVQYHREQGNVLTIATHKRSIKIDYGMMHLDVTSRVRGFEEKPEIVSPVSMGIYVMEPDVLDYIPEGAYFDFPDLVQALLADGRRVGAYLYDGLWFDIGRQEDYERAVDAWQDGERATETAANGNGNDGHQAARERLPQRKECEEVDARSNMSALLQPARKRKALITGGAGFIGSHLAELLLADGWEVYALDDVSTGLARQHRAPAGEPELPPRRRVRSLARRRQRARAQMRRRLPPRGGGRRAADRRAAGPHAYDEHPAEPRRCSSTAAGFGKRVLIASTSEVYGDHRDEKPLHEPSRRDVRAHDGPPLGVRRLEGGRRVPALAYHDERDLDCVIVRLFNTVGPRQTGQYGMVIPRFVGKRARRTAPSRSTATARRPAASATCTTRSARSRGSWTHARSPARSSTLARRTGSRSSTSPSA